MAEVDEIVNNGVGAGTDVAQILTVRRPLILLSKKPSADIVAGALGLLQYYLNIGAEPSIVSIGDTTQILPFLVRPVSVESQIGRLQDFVMQFHTDRNNIANVEIERDSNMVRVVVTPEGGHIDPRDFSLAPSRAHYGGVICVGVTNTNWEQIYPDIAQNGAAGGVLRIVIEPTAAFPIISQKIAQLLTNLAIVPNSSTAHCLLTGLVVSTEGLRSRLATADVFRLAARLMRYGGDLQEIMMRLYKDVSLEFLQLWGHLLANLQLSDDKVCAISQLARDYINIDNLTISAALRRTAQSLPNTKMFVVLIPVNTTQKENKISKFVQYKGIVYMRDIVDVRQILPKACGDLNILSDKSIYFTTKLNINEFLSELRNIR